MKEKDEAVVEETVEKQKVDIKKVILLVLIIIVSLVGVFFLSTKLRWEAEIGDKTKIFYTADQDTYKVDSLVDFYGHDIAIELEEKEAMELYCSSKFGKDCVKANYTDSFQNNLRHPMTVVNVVILIDLILLFILLREQLTGKIRTYFYAGLIILWGLFVIGSELFKIADYNKLVGDKVTTEGEAVYYIKGDNDSYIPVYKYYIEENEGQFYQEDYIKHGDFEEETVTLYYKKKNPDKMVVEKDLKKHILPIIIGALISCVGITYLNLNVKEKKEKKEEDSKSK